MEDQGQSASPPKVTDPAHEQQRWMASAETCPLQASTCTLSWAAYICCIWAAGTVTLCWRHS